MQLATSLAARVRRDLKLPVIVAPMFLVSGPELVLAAAKAGVMGSFPTQNARTIGQLKAWFDRIRTDLARTSQRGGTSAGWAVSMIVHDSYDRFDQELELLPEFRPEIVVTALGSPRRVLDAVHSYGGVVFADVMSLLHARKALDAGADGLVLVCSGSGGHTGTYSPFAFVSEVRRFFDGPLVIGGAISDGRGIRAAEVLGADLVYMGTRFIACRESMANDEYRSMLVRAGIEGVVATRAVTGVLCNWLKESVEAVGLDETHLSAPGKIDFSDVHGEHKPWKNVYGAGQGAGSVDRVASVAEVVEQLIVEYRSVDVAHPRACRAAAMTEQDNQC